MKDLFVFIVLSAALLGCNSKASNHTAVVNRPAAYTISLEPQQKTFDLCDAIEDISFVELERNDTSMIASVSKVIAVDSFYYVMDKKFTAINRYDKDGRFRGIVGSLGADKDNGEYIEVQDLNYRPGSKTLWVYSNGYSSILEFSLDGTFLRRIRTDLFASSMAATDSLYYYYVNNNTSAYSRQFNIVITDTARRVRERMFPMSSAVTESIAFSGGIVSGAGYILFNPYLNNVIYRMEGTQVIPEYNFDFGKQALPEKMITSGNIIDSRINAYGYLTSSIAMLKDVLVFSYHMGNHNSWGFFNRKNSHLALRTDSSLLPEPIVLAKFNESNGHLFTSLPNADGLLKLDAARAAALAARFPSFQASLSKIRDASNPLLISVKIKDF